MNYLNKLITNNTGVSSKNFFLVIVTIIGCLLLLVPVFALTIESLFTHTITTDLTAMAAYIGSVGTLFATAGITKAWSEKYEQKHQQQLNDGEISENINDGEEES
jgi:nitrate/nitrite transporter NarK